MKIRESYAKLYRVAASGYKGMMAATLMAGLLGGVLSASGHDGCVHDSNTVDYLEITPALTQGTLVHYTVSASGSGSNYLTVKAQQQKSGGDWVTLQTIKVKAGTSGSGSFTVQNYFTSGTSESVRFRFARDLFTNEICYDLDLTLY